MQRKMFSLSFGIGLMMLAASHAHSQTSRNCGPRDRVIERLASAYGESRQSIGLGGNNQVVEMYASIDTGTWTIIITSPNGLTCLVASGQSFEATAESDAIISGTAL